MPVGLLGKKVGMTQVYGEDGSILPVTVIEVGPCVVTQLRTADRDGYEAVQIGFDDKPRRVATRGERGHVANIASKRQKTRQSAGVELAAKADCEPKRILREFRTDGEEHGLELGQELTAAHFDGVERIDVIGTSKGRGFSGAMKRHNFSGQRATHGVKKVHRKVGSIGQSADPSRVIKGTKMAGQYGNDRRTVRYLKVVRVDADQNMVLVRGGVPGPNGGYVVLRHSTKNRMKRMAEQK
ncbi:50S ribosomal protein L3 [Stratiformator vulcanicus]|uniref:Large ribosomal subunit protein uL3 n=1 Tax=Stratiformator vulcanicus TaxID=2527980 RepID=A0A517R111_9PLAN|nr:50S ribosomal protein L3 [Stratiformator vulcanicus]QDT37524.1 50S ribosomal protein L3 [Stratiformator vulcanicus]